MFFKHFNVAIVPTVKMFRILIMRFENHDPEWSNRIVVCQWWWSIYVYLSTCYLFGPFQHVSTTDFEEHCNTLLDDELFHALKNNSIMILASWKQNTHRGSISWSSSWTLIIELLKNKNVDCTASDFYFFIVLLKRVDLPLLRTDITRTRE